MMQQTSMFDDQSFDASWPQSRKDAWAAAGAAAYREKTASPTPILAPRPPAWPDPKPLPDDLLPVAAFDADFLPASLRPWVADIAGRMQCPMDFVAVAAMTALGSVLGRKIAILRIPTKSARYSNSKPATYSDLKPAGVPTRSRSPGNALKVAG